MLFNLETYLIELHAKCKRRYPNATLARDGNVGDVTRGTDDVVECSDAEHARMSWKKQADWQHIQRLVT